jgi:hypothetical protein
VVVVVGVEVGDDDDKPLLGMRKYLYRRAQGVKLGRMGGEDRRVGGWGKGEGASPEARSKIGCWKEKDEKKKFNF